MIRHQRARKPKRERTLTDAINNAQRHVNRYIRLRDCIRTTGTMESGYCCTCGRKIPFFEAEAGHFMQGLHNATRFREDNIHLQCTRCNQHLHANLIQYYRFMLVTYGQSKIDELEAEDNTVKKYTIEEVDDIARYYRELNKQIELTGQLPMRKERECKRSRDTEYHLRRLRERLGH